MRSPRQSSKTSDRAARLRRTFFVDCTRITIALALLPRAGYGQASADDRRALLSARVAEWQNNVPRWLRETKLPGASIVVIDDGEIFWQGDFGIKNAATGEPVTRDTVFAACSNTKPVFAYAVVKLCEMGVMDLDTPLTRYTSKRFLDGDPRLDLITTRHVLNHTTGFPNWRNDREPLAIQFTPGTQRQYSGEGFYYLQSVVEEITKQPFVEFMQERILDPFGMTSSRFEWDDDEAFASRVAKGHDENGMVIAKPPTTPEERRRGLATYGAAAMLHTTTTDYSKFLFEILDPKPADGYRLNAASWTEYLRPQFRRDEVSSSSLGWVVAEASGMTAFTHAGADAGWNCDVKASVDRKAGILIMTNGDNFLPFYEKLGQDVEFLTLLFKP